MNPVDGGRSANSNSATLRDDVLACLRASISAVDPARLVRDHLAGNPLVADAVRVVAIGKAAGTMASGAHEVLGDRFAECVIIAPPDVEIPAIPRAQIFRGGHPIPNEEGEAGARRILELATELKDDDVLLCLISGGGSALMTLPPPGVTLDEVRQTTDLLLRAGADIRELNSVRKHLDQLKGGRLARAAAPARTIGLVLSDVAGDPLDVIASGPLSPDPTTFRTAVGVLTAYELQGRLPGAVRRHLDAGVNGEVEESPGEGDPAFENVEVHVVGSNRIAAAAARREAERRGYATLLLTTTMRGEARHVGQVLASIGEEVRRSGHPIAAPACILAAGETTVTVRGDGRGGRNQELALAAAIELQGRDGIVVGSIGTDGIDGPTDAAGAIVDGSTLARGTAAHVDAHEALSRNDAYPFLRATHDLLITGPTGTNVMDIQVVLVSRGEG